MSNFGSCRLTSDDLSYFGWNDPVAEQEGTVTALLPER